MRRPIVLVAAMATIPAAAALAATSATPLPVSNLFSERGKPTPLRSGVTYEANKSFPTGLQLTITGRGWAGAQWRTGHGPGPVGRNKPPFYGWAVVLAGPITKAPLGAIIIMTPWAATPSVAALVTSLRTRGNGATYGPMSPVAIAGYMGMQFEATITGREHAFIPFSRTTGAAAYYGDAVFFGKGEHVRVTALNVRGKSVLIFVENARLRVDQFPAFLSRVDAMLQTLKFSK